MKRSVILLQVSHFIEHYRMERRKKKKENSCFILHLYSIVFITVNSTSFNLAFFSFDFPTLLVLFNALIMIYFDVIQYQLYCYICIIFFGLGFFFESRDYILPLFFFRGRSRKEQIYCMLTILQELGWVFYMWYFNPFNNSIKYVY